MVETGGPEILPANRKNHQEIGSRPAWAIMPPCRLGARDRHRKRPASCRPFPFDDCCPGRISVVLFVAAELGFKRLSLTRNGNVRYQLTTPYRDGTTHAIFDPSKLMERIPLRQRVGYLRRSKSADLPICRRLAGSMTINKLVFRESMDATAAGHG
jgi:hypothetical protein